MAFGLYVITTKLDSVDKSIRNRGTTNSDRGIMEIRFQVDIKHITFLVLIVLIVANTCTDCAVHVHRGKAGHGLMLMDYHIPKI